MSRISGMADRIPVDVAYGPNPERLLEGPEWDALKGARPATLEVASNKSPALNPTRFLCRAQVRNFLLEYARENRAHKYSRVSEDTLIEINEQVRYFLIARVRRLPSKGKTI
jgi:hypothetical protein